MNSQLHLRKNRVGLDPPDSIDREQEEERFVVAQRKEDSTIYMVVFGSGQCYCGNLIYLVFGVRVGRELQRVCNGIYEMLELDHYEVSFHRAPLIAIIFRGEFVLSKQLMVDVIRNERARV